MAINFKRRFEKEWLLKMTRPSDITRTRILKAAERLFADRGFVDWKCSLPPPFGPLMYPKHWTNTLFIAFGILCGLVFSYMPGGVLFGAVSFFGFVGVCLASAVSFLAGAGVKGSLLIGTRSKRMMRLGQRFRGSNHIRRPRQACRTKCG